VCSHASLTNNITLGRHVHINLNCTIGHDAVIDDYVTLSPLVAVSGNVRIEECGFLGTGATINPGVSIGAGAVVGSGAAIVHDVPAGTTVVGVPAKPL
jgi:acetyltransferase-like isoleucine patch superfamily enzyme